MNEEPRGWAVFAGTEDNATACRKLLQRLTKGWYGKVEFEVKDGRPVLVKVTQSEAICSATG